MAKARIRIGALPFWRIDPKYLEKLLGKNLPGFQNKAETGSPRPRPEGGSNAPFAKGLRTALAISICNFCLKFSLPVILWFDGFFYFKSFLNDCNLVPIESSLAKGLCLNLSITRKLLIGVVIASSVITVFVTAFNLFQDYHSQIELTKEKFDILMVTNQSSLEKSVWDLNVGQIDSTVKGFMNYPGINYVSIEYMSVDKNEVLTYGVMEPNTIKKSYKLKADGQTIGKLQIGSHISNVFNHLQEALIFTIITNMIKTFASSMLILLVINRLLTKHLVMIANFLGKDNTDKELVLKRREIFGAENDELSQIVEKTNEVFRYFRNNRVELEEIVNQRTAELEEAKFSAEKASQAKSEFLSNISHEIRTPLNGIIGSCEILQSLSLSDEQKSFVETINFCSLGLMTQVNEILDYAKLESTEIKFNDADYCPKELMENLINLASAGCRLKDVAVEGEVSPLLPSKIYGDYERVKQICLNIVNNAIKFTPQGKISISFLAGEFRENGAFDLIIKVSDTGVGINGVKIKQLFEPFSQIENSTTRTNQGTGLGLAICRSLAEKMGGQVQVQSVEGIGSTFTVTINQKVGQSQKQTNPVKVESFVELEGGAATRILVVDDVELNTMILGRFLEKLNLQSHAVHSGEEALNAMAEKTYDLVFLDLHMPVMDGFEVSKKIKNLYGEQVYIIIYTAAHIESLGMDDRQQYFDALLSKPIKLENLKVVLKKYYAVAGRPPLSKAG